MLWVRSSPSAYCHTLGSETTTTTVAPRSLPSRPVAHSSALPPKGGARVLGGTATRAPVGMNDVRVESTENDITGSITPPSTEQGSSH
jgi:hypothetical protein